MDFSAIRQSLSEVENTPKKVCAVCQAPADKSCGACHQIYYCSVEHQKSHWKVHKKDCPPIRIATSQEFGRHFVATRDLSAGTLVISETPILSIPLILSGEGIICISCSINFGRDECRLCSKCQWIFCSSACAKNYLHTGVECMALANATKENKIKILMSPNLDYLRALNLKQKEPEKWRKMMELQGADKYKSLEEGDENDKWFAKEILPLFGQIGQDFVSDILKVKGILQTNGFKKHAALSSSYGPARGIISLLYLQTSLFSNACFPNTCKLIGSGPEFRLNAKTTVNVKKGAIISICYGENTVITGAIKIQHTGEFGSFICRCPRCVDPTGTELGTMLSAVKCTERGCKKGYLLPVNPLDMDMGAVWKCNGSEGGCNGTSTWEKVDEIVSKLEDEMKALISDSQLKEFKGMKAFLDKLKNELHPNHWVLMKFQNEVTDKLDRHIVRYPKLSESRIELHILMIEDLLRMAEFTSPGSSWPKALLLTIFFNALCFRLDTIGVTHHTGKLRKNVMSKILKVADELLPIARLYPYDWPAKKLNAIEFQRDRIKMAM